MIPDMVWLSIVAPKSVTKMIDSLVMVFAPQVFSLVQSNEWCGQGWKVPKGAHISLLSAHRRVTIRVFQRIFYDLSFTNTHIFTNNGGGIPC